MKISRMILTTLIVSGWLLTVAQTPPGRRSADPRTQWQGKDLKVGDRAPDFELPQLDPFLKAASGVKPQVQLERLSAWQGKRPVLLVFSSYT